MSELRLLILLRYCHSYLKLW